MYVGEAYKNRVRAVKVANGAGQTLRCSVTNELSVSRSRRGRGLKLGFGAGAIKTLAGSGTRGYQDGGPSVARFSWPYGVAAAPDGEVVYVTDSGNDCIRLVWRNPPLQ